MSTDHEPARLPPRKLCPDCGCTCGVCRYRHRVAADAAPPLSHAIVCPVTFEILDEPR